MVGLKIVGIVPIACHVELRTEYRWHFSNHERREFSRKEMTFYFVPDFNYGMSSCAFCRLNASTNSWRISGSALLVLIYNEFSETVKRSNFIRISYSILLGFKLLIFMLGFNYLQQQELITNELAFTFNYCVQIGRCFRGYLNVYRILK